MPYVPEKLSLGQGKSDKNKVPMRSQKAGAVGDIVVYRADRELEPFPPLRVKLLEARCRGM